MSGAASASAFRADCNLERYCSRCCANSCLALSYTFTHLDISGALRIQSLAVAAPGCLDLQAGVDVVWTLNIEREKLTFNISTSTTL